MWVHPDLASEVMIPSRPAKGKKDKSCRTITASTSDVQVTTRSAQQRVEEAEQEEEALPSKTTAPDAAQAGPSQAPGVEKQKQKGVRFDKPLRKDSEVGAIKPYNFDILAQLANTPARLSLFELLRLSKDTRGALSEALLNADSFLAQVRQTEEDPKACRHCHSVMEVVPNITFSQGDMLLRHNRHNRPLYYTGYIGSVQVDRIHIDPGSSLSIIPLSHLQTLGIPMHRLTASNTIISGLNADRSHPLGKIRLKCQIGDLHTEVTCYVINADVSYKVLLGRPWIHEYMIVPSILHQCMKYVTADGVVKTEFADADPF